MKRKNIMYGQFKLIILSGILLLLQANAWSQNVTFEEKKHISKAFILSDGAQIEISNKYGYIDVRKSLGDTVKFEIYVTVKGTSLDKVLKIKNSIDFSFTNTESYLIAFTTFGTSQNKLLTDITNISNAIVTLGTEAIVNYTVWLPTSANLKISNGFGDIYLPDISGTSSIDLAHGDLRAGTFYGDTRIKVTFGKVYVKEVKSGSITIEYGDFNAKKVDRASIASKSSNIEIDNAVNLTVDSKRDRFKINAANSIRGIGSFSKFNLERINHDLSLNLSFGSMNIGTVSHLFTVINVNSNYTDISIGFEESTSCRLNITYSDLNLLYPTETINVKTQVVDPAKKVNNLTGLIGLNTGTTSKVTIVASRGDIKLFMGKE